MEKSRNAAERIRPILEAMGRSIDTARRQRTKQPEDAPSEYRTGPREGGISLASPPQQTPADERKTHVAEGGHEPDYTRMKARPKRPSGYHDNSSSQFRSAG